MTESTTIQTTQALRRTTSALSGVVASLRTTSKSVGQVAQAVSAAGKAAAKSGSTAKKLKGQVRDLFAFDQINRLSAASTAAAKKSSRGSSSRSGSGGSGRAGQIQEEVTWLERLKSLLAQLAAPLKKFWSMNGGETLKAFQNLRSRAADLANVLKTGLKWGYDHILAPLGKWTLSSAAPAVMNLLANTIRILSADCRILGPVAAKVWELFFQPLAQWNGKVVAGMLQGAADSVGWLADRLEGLEGLLHGGSIIGRLHDFGANAWQSIVGGLTGGFGAVRDAFHQLLDNLYVGGAQLSAQRPLTMPVQLSASAESVWGKFSGAWHQGNRTVTVTDKLKNSAFELWSSLKSTWGERSLSIRNYLQSSAAALWSGFKTAWGSRVLSIQNKLATSAATLWNNLKSGWKNKNLSLTVTYSTSVGALKTAVYKALGLAGWPSLKFAARGGIVPAASLFGSTLVGEDGMEAIIPLERHTEWMDRVADRLAAKLEGGSGRQSAPMVVQVVLDGRVVGQTAVDYINRQARAGGVHPLSAYL